MHDQSNAYQELIEENSFLKHRIKELEQSEADLKQIEVALKESERRLADIIHFLPDATFAIDLSGKIIAWNHAIEEMTGVKAENILGKGDYEHAVPFYGLRRPTLIDLVFEFTEESEKKYDFIRREGDILLAETNELVEKLQNKIFTPFSKVFLPLIFARSSLLRHSPPSIFQASPVKRCSPTYSTGST